MQEVEETVARPLAWPERRERLPGFPERPADPLEPERFERRPEPPKRRPPARFEPRLELLEHVPLLWRNFLDGRRLEPQPDTNHARVGEAARQFGQRALDGPDVERRPLGCALAQRLSLRALLRDVVTYRSEGATEERLAPLARGRRRSLRRGDVGDGTRARGVSGPNRRIVDRAPARALGVAGVPAPHARIVLLGHRSADRKHVATGLFNNSVWHALGAHVA